MEPEAGTGKAEGLRTFTSRGYSHIPADRRAHHPLRDRSLTPRVFTPSYSSTIHNYRRTRTDGITLLLQKFVVLLAALRGCQHASCARSLARRRALLAATRVAAGAVAYARRPMDAAKDL